MQKWRTEIKISEITWGLCCRSPDFLLPQTEDLQHMPWHIAKRHFGCLQILIDMLRLNWKPEQRERDQTSRSVMLKAYRESPWNELNTFYTWALFQRELAGLFQNRVWFQSLFNYVRKIVYTSKQNAYPLGCNAKIFSSFSSKHQFPEENSTLLNFRGKS